MGRVTQYLGAPTRYFIYMLLCQEQRPTVYVKIGYTTSPYDRVKTLVAGATTPPKVFSYFEVYTKAEALLVEKELHKAYADWNHHHEWFVFSEADKVKFNEVWQMVLRRYSKGGKRKFEWISISAAALRRLIDDNKLQGFLKHKKNTETGPLSRQDFVRDSQGEIS